MTDTMIVLSPTLGLTPDEVAAAWNAGHGQDAPARVQQSSAESFDLAGIGFVVISGIAINLLSTLIYDTVKSVFAEKHRPPPALRITVSPPQPDGRITIVIAEER